LPDGHDLTVVIHDGERINALYKWLPCAPEDDDRESDGRAVRVGVVARHSHDAAAQARQDIGDVGQAAARGWFEARPVIGVCWPCGRAR